MFWFSKSLNFGDWITPYLFEKIRGEKPVFSAPNPNSSSTTILSVGSIISESQPNSIRINDEVLKSLPNLIMIANSKLQVAWRLLNVMKG